MEFISFLEEHNVDLSNVKFSPLTKSTIGALRKWLKSLVGLKKTQSSHQENVGSSVKGRKWRLWRSDKGGHVAASDLSSFGVDDVFSAVVATVVRGTTKEFMVVKQEWAAIRIQTMFRDSLFDWAGQGPRGSTPWRVQWQRSGWGRAVRSACGGPRGSALWQG
ncbi:hypothetical protein HYC85_028014 [Camellia sinensis]|uniref:Uncharacterized protein n=1 Tax=Camellia sinensis TaxID=4442 RepID=A0A7J7FTX2_CAMSI|nr:hypothetical protein HYC85_028014 [Camellia sinensis]